MKKSPGLINVDCGGVIFMNGTGEQGCHWKYDVYWGNHGNSSNLPEATPLVFTKNKNNELVKVNSSNDNVVYIKKMFYYFEKPKEDDVKEVLEPCAITIAYSECPSIILPDCKSNLTIRTGVTTFGVVNTSQVIQVKLLSRFHPNYYDGEIISYSRMDFTEDKLINVEGSSKNITSQFDVNVYDIVQLTYKCLGASGEYNIISQIFYFEPNTTEGGLEKVAYVKEDAEIQPNCSLTFMNIGYLEAITHHGITTTSDKWNDTYITDERFRLKDGYIFLKDINDRVTELQCVYGTPGSKITKAKEFTAGKYVTNPGGGRSIDTSVPVVDDTKLEKAIEEKRRKMSAYHKMVHAYGKLTTHIIIIILIIVGAIITTILLKNPNLYYFWDILTVESFETYCIGITDKNYMHTSKPTFKIEGGEEVDVGISDQFDGSLVKSYDDSDKKIKAHYVYSISDNVNYIHCD
uniref:Glycoprotein n=1 Tax=Strongyloides papillosus TaxID=174720 RepID=A0A0N5BQL9_STREA